MKLIKEKVDYWTHKTKTVTREEMFGCSSPDEFFINSKNRRLRRSDSISSMVSQFTELSNNQTKVIRNIENEIEFKSKENNKEQGQKINHIKYKFDKKSPKTDTEISYKNTETSLPIELKGSLLSDSDNIKTKSSLDILLNLVQNDYQHELEFKQQQQNNNIYQIKYFDNSDIENKDNTEDSWSIKSDDVVSNQESITEELASSIPPLLSVKDRIRQFKKSQVFEKSTSKIETDTNIIKNNIKKKIQQLDSEKKEVLKIDINKNIRNINSQSTLANEIINKTNKENEDEDKNNFPVIENNENTIEKLKKKNDIAKSNIFNKKLRRKPSALLVVRCPFLFNTNESEQENKLSNKESNRKLNKKSSTEEKIDITENHNSINGSKKEKNEIQNKDKNEKRNENIYENENEREDGNGKENKNKNKNENENINENENKKNEKEKRNKINKNKLKNSHNNIFKNCEVKSQNIDINNNKNRKSLLSSKIIELEKKTSDKQFNTKILSNESLLTSRRPRSGSSSSSTTITDKSNEINIKSPSLKVNQTFEKSKSNETSTLTINCNEIQFTSKEDIKKNESHQHNTTNLFSKIEKNDHLKLLFNNKNKNKKLEEINPNPISSSEKSVETLSSSSPSLSLKVLNEPNSAFISVKERIKKWKGLFNNNNNNKIIKNNDIDSNKNSKTKENIDIKDNVDNNKSNKIMKNTDRDKNKKGDINNIINTKNNYCVDIKSLTSNQSQHKKNDNSLDDKTLMKQSSNDSIFTLVYNDINNIKYNEKDKEKENNQKDYYKKQENKFEQDKIEIENKLQISLSNKKNITNTSSVCGNERRFREKVQYFSSFTNNNQNKKSIAIENKVKKNLFFNNNNDNDYLYNNELGLYRTNYNLYASSLNSNYSSKSFSSNSTLYY